jgi:hypothetical protein
MRASCSITLFRITADSSPEPAVGGLADTGGSCAWAMPPSKTNPAQPAEHLLCHDFRDISFPLGSDIAQVLLHTASFRCFGFGYVPV